MPLSFFIFFTYTKGIGLEMYPIPLLHYSFGNFGR